MPIVFVHGVTVRTDSPEFAASWKSLESFLGHYIAPVISTDHEHVAITYAPWGRFGAHFYWDTSIPRGQLLGMGPEEELGSAKKAIVVAELHDALSNLPTSSSTSTPEGDLIPMGPVSTPSASSPGLTNLDSTELSDLMATVLQNMPGDPSDPQQAQQKTLAVLAADDVAHNPDTHKMLEDCPDSDSEVNLLQQLVTKRYSELLAQDSDLLGMGAQDVLENFAERLKEVVSRAEAVPGFVATRVLDEVRRPINEQIALFFGDVFTYLDKRGNASNPGDIPTEVLKTLDEARINQQQRGGEPLIVLSHSMGGQIVYDLVTYFLPNIPKYSEIRIDFWCAAASQVGLFEDLKLFKASKPVYCKPPGESVPFPDPRYLGGWWNVWDPNDYLSYTAQSIIAGIDDSPYSSGMSVAHAHGGYLVHPSFFHNFANKLTAAKAKNWGRP